MKKTCDPQYMKLIANTNNNIPSKGLAPTNMQKISINKVSPKQAVANAVKP